MRTSLCRHLPLALLLVTGCSTPETEALAACEGAVERLLVAPSTAEFAPAGEATIERTRVGYLVRSSVEAQNAFGVPLRQEFLCRVEGGMVKGEPVAGASLATRQDCATNDYMVSIMPDETLRILAERRYSDDFPECAIYERAPLPEGG